jgi:hypothetical protein
MGVFQNDPTYIGYNPNGAGGRGEQNPYGQAYGQDQGMARQDAGGQQAIGNSYGMMAAGGGPNPALATMQAGIGAGQEQAQAQAGSARGNFGLAGAQHGAMQTSANLTQAGAAQGGVLAQQQQMNAMQMQAQMAISKRSQDLQAQGISAEQADQQAKIEAANAAQNTQAQTNLATGFMGMLGGLAGGAGH